MADEPLVVRESDIPLEAWSDPVRGTVGFRTVFGGDTETDSLTVGVTELEVGGWLGHHQHEPAEVYYVIEGTGTVVLDGVGHAITAGSVVFIPSNLGHGIRNTGRTLLRFFYAFAVDSFDDIEYRFTDGPDMP